MKPLQPYSLCFKDISISKLQSIPLSCTTGIADEIFSGLSFYADVPVAGKDLLRSKGVQDSDLDQAHQALKSFIRQAQTFYKAATVATTRASPLIYYYSFLNLSKAIILFDNPNTVDGKILHGLTFNLSKDSLDKQKLKINKTGVFPLLYKHLTGDVINQEIQIDLLSLFAYCTDITFEIHRTNLVQQMIAPFLGRILVNQSGDQASLVLATPNMSLLESSNKFKTDFYSYFEEVTITEAQITNIFGLEVSGLRSMFRFFQSKKTYSFTGAADIPAILSDCRVTLDKYISENSFNEKEYVNFYFNSPLPNSNDKPFNEPLAIYSIFYFLSSLVRYYPVSFEEQFETQDAWMIESFLRATPLTLLRLLANRIFGENRQFYSR